MIAVMIIVMIVLLVGFGSLCVHRFSEQDIIGGITTLGILLVGEVFVSLYITKLMS